MDYQINIQLDTRRVKSNGTYPVKLRVYSPVNKKAKLYATGLDLSKDDFFKTWETQKPRKEYKENRIWLETKLSEANKVAKKIEPFTFEQFEKRHIRKKGSVTNIIFHFTERIEAFTENSQFSMASIHKQSLKSLKGFIKDKTGREPKNISFHSINTKWLNEYEKYMIKTGRSLTTVSYYLRAVRQLFKDAIEAKDVDKVYYPFGRGKYEIPSQKRVKKALNKEQLKTLYHAEPLTPSQTKAKDFWFLSYYLQGANIKDIALLKYKNIVGDNIVFVREKTKNARRSERKEITIYLTDKPKATIKKYGKENPQPDDYIFDIIEHGFSPELIHRKVGLFTGFINQHIKKFAKAAGLPTEIHTKISTYYARHSFATNGIRNNASIEQMAKALGHSDTKTTEGYFAGFEDAEMRKLVQSLTDF